MQVLDIQDVELWEDFFKLPADENHLAEALVTRASMPLKRWRPMGRDLRRRDDFQDRPSVLRRLVPEASRVSSERLNRLLGQ